MNKVLLIYLIIPLVFSNTIYAEGYLGPDTTICIGQCIILSAPVPTTEWSTGEVGKSIKVCLTEQDTVYASYSTGTIGFPSNDTIIIMVRPLSGGAEIPILLDSTILDGCQGECIKIQGVANGVSYSWTPTIGIDSPNITNPKICGAYLNNYYSVEVMGDTTGECIYSFDLQIRNAPQPDTLSFKTATICMDSCITISGPSGGQSYSWFPTDGINDPTIKTPLACPDITTSYVVSVMTDTTINCIYKDTVLVDVKDTCIPSGLSDIDLSYNKMIPKYYEGKIYMNFQKRSTQNASAVVEIYGINGQQLYSKISNVKELENGLFIDQKNINSGMYIISVITSEHAYSSKNILFQ